MRWRWKGRGFIALDGVSLVNQIMSVRFWVLDGIGISGSPKLPKRATGNCGISLVSENVNSRFHLSVPLDMGREVDDC
jgi:hypothetical protein